MLYHGLGELFVGIFSCIFRLIFRVFFEWENRAGACSFLTSLLHSLLSLVYPHILFPLFPLFCISTES